MSLSENIRMLRQRSLLNQETFAEALNVSLITVHRWESGKSIPNLTAMRALKEYCRRNGIGFELLEKDWLSERMTEKKQKAKTASGKSEQR